MFIIFLFIIMIAVFFFFNTQLSQKINIQKKQILILIKENNALKEKQKLNFNKDKNIVIKYIESKYKFGLISNSCDLLLSPTISSQKLRALNKNTEVIIVDCAEVNNFIWYEINVKSKDTINNKGWIQSQNIILFENSVINTNN